MFKKIGISVVAGCIFIFAYCFTLASSSVWVNYVESFVDPAIVIFYALLITTLFFNLVNIHKYRTTVTMFREHLPLVIKINLSSTILWAATFYCLKYLNPAVFMALLFGVVPVATAILTLHQDKPTQVRKVEFYFSGLLFLLLASISLNHLLVAADKKVALASLVLAAVGGCFSAYTNVLSRQFADLKYTASHVLAVRFYLITLVAFLVIIFSPLSFTLSLKIYFDIVLVAALSLMLPLFLLQKGIERLDTVLVSFIIPFVPVFTFFIQMVNPQYAFSKINFTLILLLTVAIIVSAAIKGRLSIKN